MSETSSERILSEWLREAERVLAFTGAGVSAESGLPTFRGSGGLWEGHAIEDVATPEGFRRDPRRVWTFYAERQKALVRAQPNPAHRVLAAMEERYPDFLLVTQNVDDLHERAGSRKLVKLHGSLMEVRCARCGEVERLDAPLSSARIREGELPRHACGGLLRPNVVWFGEYLDPAHFERIQAFCRACPAPLGAGGRTLLLIIGTSGEVGGGYGLTSLARLFGAKIVEINPEPSALSLDVDLAIRAPAGEVLGRVGRGFASAPEKSGLRESLEG